MGRGKDESIRKLSKVGGTSYAVTLPVALVRAFGWRERQRLKIEADEQGKCVTIRALSEMGEAG